MVSELRACAPPESSLLGEQVSDLEAMAVRLEEASFDAADAKYVAQRAYNAHRAKRGYEDKLRRG
jgi:hypothetical protein